MATFPTNFGGSLPQFGNRTIDSPFGNISIPTLPTNFQVPPPNQFGGSPQRTPGTPTSAPPPPVSAPDTRGNRSGGQRTQFPGQQTGSGGQFNITGDQSSILNSLSGFPPSAEGLRSWWGQYGSSLSSQGISFIDHPTDPKLQLPNGMFVDLIQGAGAPGARFQFLLESGAGGGFAGGFSSGGGGAPGLNLNQFFNKAKPQGAPTVGNPNSKFMKQVRKEVMAALGQAKAPVSIDDPELKGQQQGFIRQTERADERAARQQAEALNAQGLAGSGAAEVSREARGQQFGESISANAANLLGQEHMRRRNELQNLLGQAASIGDRDLTRQLQAAISNADRKFAANQVALQDRLQQASLALQQQLGLGNLSLGFGGLGLGQQRLGLDENRFRHQAGLQNDIFNAGQVP